MATQVKGLEDLLNNFTKIEHETIEAAKDSLNDGAEAVKVIAEPWTPMKEGLLRRSARVIKVPINAFKVLRSRVRWGNSKVNYAQWVHDMPASFNYTTPSTGPKFASRAAAVVLSRLPGEMAKKIRGRLIQKFPPTNRSGAATVTVNING